MTPLIPVVYNGRTVAVASRSRFFLCDDLDSAPVRDPDRRWVIYLCAYAGDILNGRLPAPYDPEEARACARACLIPAELVEREGIDVDRVAGGLGVPVRELDAARRTASAPSGYAPASEIDCPKRSSQRPTK